MDQLNTVISENLSRIRKERNLSLDKVSKLTGVSKSMLGQIERGESNPTITTVWKIANGLKISFTSLINQDQRETEIIEKENLKPLIEDNGKYRLYPYFPYEEGRNFESYKVEIEKGGYLAAEAHSKGVQEFVTVFEGQVTIMVGNEEFTVGEGDAIRFLADQSHAYHNSGSELTKLNMILFYPENQ